MMNTDSRNGSEMNNKMIAIKRGTPVYVGVSESPMKEARVDPLLSIRTNQPLSRAPPNQTSELTRENSILGSSEQSQRLNETVSEQIDKALMLVSETVKSSLPEENDELQNELQSKLSRLFQLLQESSFVVLFLFYSINSSCLRQIPMFTFCHPWIDFSFMTTS